MKVELCYVVMVVVDTKLDIDDVKENMQKTLNEALDSNLPKDVEFRVGKVIY